MAVLLLLLFLVWPFGTVLFSFSNVLNSWVKNVLWLFVIYYGYTFVLSDEMLDAYRTFAKFQMISQSDLSFTEIINYYYFDNEDGADIIQPIIFFLIRPFVSDFQVFMAVLGIVFGFFYSRNIDYLMCRSQGKIKPYNYLVILLFLVVIGFWEINRFRFFTSALIFYYSVMPFIFEGRKLRLWLLPLTFLLHFSFIFPCIIFLFYLISKTKVKFYFSFFLVSFFLVSIDATKIGEIIIQYLPSNFHAKIEGYTNENYVAQQAENIKSISYIMRYLMYLVINSYFVLFYFSYRHIINSDKVLMKLFAFVLLFMSASNFISIIPSGERFLTLSCLFSLSFLFFFFQGYDLKPKHRLLKRISTPIFLISAFGFLRLSFDTVDLVTIIGNPFIAIFNDTHKAIIEYFK